ncbi:MAG: FHA domain-containing protein [Sandaracinaceae bacterium]|nr:FHA domain-containing protein [Sandaracinaceae bacterium]
MSFLRRVFDATYRRARRAEGRGEYREAAELYAEAGADEEAGEAWLFHAARQQEVEARVAAYRDALRWFPAGTERAREIAGHMGMARLEDAQRRGVHTAEDRQRLEQAAAHLEEAQRPAYAATAFELLGYRDDAIRCLEAAGEIERLEALLETAAREGQAERERRAAVRDYEVAMVVGQRREAMRALQRGVAAARTGQGDVADTAADAEVRDLVRRLEARRTAPTRCALRVANTAVSLLGALPVTIGREGDVTVRGTGVSRAHCRLSLDARGVVLEDLGSRNGTLVSGVPLGAPLSLSGPSDAGLGDDVRVRVEPGAAHVVVRVLSGLDAGTAALAGVGALELPGVAASVTFEEGYPVLRGAPGGQVLLDGQRCVAPVDLLVGDRLSIDGVPVEVVS